MWKLFAATCALILAPAVTPLHAEEFPWCVKMDVFTKNCAFANHSECAEIARNAGASCIRNPDYRAPAAAAALPKPAPRKASDQQR
jgi:hypothetical protein